MAAQKWLNNFDWTIIGPVAASTHVGYETNLGKGIIQISDSASGTLLSLTGGDWYTLTLFKRSGSIESAIEIIKVLGVNEAGYVAAGECRLRVERGSEGTTPQTYVAGDLVSMRITAGGLNAMASDSELAAHTGNTSNPHSTTKAHVGLGNVDNTADTAKPVSTAQATAIALKQDALVSGTNIKTINGQALPGSGDITVGGLARVLVTGTTQAAASGSDYWATNAAATTLTAPAAADGAKFAFTPANSLLTNAIDFGATTVLGPFGTMTGILTLDLGLRMEFEYSTTLGKWVMQ